MGVVTTNTDKMQSCIDVCSRCAQACQECIRLCLEEPDVAARKEHIKNMMGCAAICKEAACFMEMESTHIKEICQLCAFLCEECASGCAQFQDEHCQKCAAECRKCAQECRSM
ncbi:MULTISPECIES: four-helix bundle copper-binding protein [Caproicibacterium]|uniref:Four-helix bundle copper-binding protein n=1 Tax=Caproicibacterium argilliputei TaxID=3030016 RepID=A0AA97DDG8_9FIRM|nr:four-helix bundle copper-binding protein [Caproicibacterium argilliputei]WOC33505.1 four-helix bundle copper-binding protein [Caproicibacterium argilliputei]